jgi:hypothetical protein
MRKALSALRPITRAGNLLWDGYLASGHTDIEDRAQSITFRPRIQLCYGME